jgi:hypothetical protein
MSSKEGTFRKGSSLLVGGGATSSSKAASMPSDSSALRARTSSANGGTWDDIGGVVEFELSSSKNVRSLAGGSFPAPESESDDDSEDDSESQSSTSLQGAGFVAGDVGSRTYMEYSGDESFGRVTPTSTSLLGDAEVPLSRSQYLLDHDDEYESESGSISSGLTDDDAYFKYHPIAPRSMLNVPGTMKNQHDDDILPGLSSQDEAIFEDDEGAKSSSSEQQQHQGGSRHAFDTTPNTSLLLKKVSSLAWDTYDQDRGRYAGQSRNVKQQRGASPSTPSTVSRSPSPSDNRTTSRIKSFITKQPIRRCNNKKRLESEYQVVDATIHQQIARGSALRYSDHVVDSSVESESEDKSTSGDQSSTSSGSTTGWESGDSDESSNQQQVQKETLPDGLIPRASVEDMLDELNIGPPGLSAIQELRRMLKEASSTTPCFQIQGMEIPNYQAEVQEAVANYRRTTLKITDESYLSMLHQDKSIAAV